METKNKYWVACGNCGAPQMQDPDEPAPANALECEICGHMQPKPLKPREVARFLAEAVPDDKDPVILMQRLTDAAKALFAAGGSFIGFAQIEGVAGVFHGGMYDVIQEAAIREMERDGHILEVLRRAIAAVDHSNAAEAAQNIVPERDTFDPDACGRCGTSSFISNGTCEQCGERTDPNKAPEVCEFCFAPGGNHYNGCNSETISKLRGLHNNNL